MDNDRRAALVSKVKRLFVSAVLGGMTDSEAATAVIDRIYPEALEEAAVACENIYGDDGYGAGDWPTPEECAAAIRALKEKA